MIRVYSVFLFFAMITSIYASGAAKGNLGLGILYEQFDQQDESSNTTTESTTTKINMDAGFAIDKGLYIGAKIIKHTTEYGASSSLDRSAYGVCVGWFDPSGFEAIYTTLLNSQIEYTNTGDTTLNYKLSGSSGGSVIELSYKGRSGQLTVGPRLSYIVLQYDTLTNSSGRQNLNSATVETIIQPYFGIWFDF